MAVNITEGSEILTVPTSPPVSTTLQILWTAVKSTLVVNAGAIPELILTVKGAAAAKLASLFPQTKNLLSPKNVFVFKLFVAKIRLTN